MADSPAEGMSPAVQAAFARLRDRFVDGLPQRWQEIQAADAGPALAAALHRLVGAAASYGLAPLGEAARRAEALALASGKAPQAALSQALAELQRQIDTAVTVR